MPGPNQMTAVKHGVITRFQKLGRIPGGSVSLRRLLDYLFETGAVHAHKLLLLLKLRWQFGWIQKYAPNSRRSVLALRTRRNHEKGQKSIKPGGFHSWSVSVFSFNFSARREED